MKEFDKNKTYNKILSKEETIRILESCDDKDFMVVFLPRTTTNADILIRSLEVEE